MSVILLKLPNVSLTAENLAAELKWNNEQWEITAKVVSVTTDKSKYHHCSCQIQCGQFYHIFSTQPYCSRFSKG